MKNFLATMILSACVLAYCPANAATFTCELNPKIYLAVDGSGSVLTAISKQSGFAITTICNLKNDNGVSTQACIAWYSTLLSMRMSNGTALPHFNNADPSNAGHSSCDNFQSWETHLPYFLLLK